MYTKEVIKHFRRPKNLGPLKNADVCAQVGNPICGDVLKIYLKVINNKITQIGFETIGCVAAIATSSMITELAKGKTLTQAKKITFQDIAKQLGGLPKVKMHCSQLAVQALQQAIKIYEQKNKS